MNTTDLKVYTSFVSPVTMELFREKNLLPVFIIRKIQNSELIGMYEGTSIHLKELSPSNELFRKKRDKEVTLEEFAKEYILEISQTVDFDNIIKRLNTLAELSGADGIVMLGYGSDCNLCHRSVLAEILNSLGVFKNKVTELPILPL